MRKLWIALAGAAVIALAVAGVASAVNTYEVDIADATDGKGSLKRPIPARLDFGYEVDDTEDLRPHVIRQYRIAAEGLYTYPDARPKCTFEQATDPSALDASDLSAACRRAIVGDGTISNEAGAPNDRTQKLTCDVQLTLINISTGDPRYPSDARQIRRRGGMAIRIDTYLPETSRCPIPVHEALAAPFFNVKIDRVATSELRFPVPDTLAHPGGLDNSVVDVASEIDRKVGRVVVRNGKPVPASNDADAAAKRRVGFYSLVGRRGRTRTVRVTFVDESGRKFTARRNIR
jgi:hypothetical protein